MTGRRRRIIDNRSQAVVDSLYYVNTDTHRVHVFAWFHGDRQFLGLDTAWRAEFRFSARGVGRIIGVNAEMDARPGIGDGCGHNLIAMVGVAVTLALGAALEKHNVLGTVILLSTPGACSTVQYHIDFSDVMRYY